MKTLNHEIDETDEMVSTLISRSEPFIGSAYRSAKSRACAAGSCQMGRSDGGVPIVAGLQKEIAHALERITHSETLSVGLTSEIALSMQIVGIEWKTTNRVPVSPPDAGRHDRAVHRTPAAATVQQRADHLPRWHE